MEDIEELGHPSRNIPNEAYPDDMPRPEANLDGIPRPEANPDDLPLPDEAHPDDMPDEHGGETEMPAQVATCNQLPLSLHSFMRGRRSPGNVGLSSAEGASFISNRRLLSPPRRTPPPSYLESVQDPVPSFQMIPLRPGLPQGGPMQPGQPAPQNDFVPPCEVVRALCKRMTMAKWQSFGFIGVALLIIGSVAAVMTVGKPSK